ncbi:unnamed protein product, partial [marine sediment metagenome]
VRKFVFVVVLVALYFTMGGNLLNSTTSANSGNIIPTFNNKLMVENDELKKNNAVLEQRLLEMERTVVEIDDEYNRLYAEYLGVDFDTTNFHMYRNDSAAFIF